MFGFILTIGMNFEEVKQEYQSMWYHLCATIKIRMFKLSNIMEIKSTGICRKSWNLDTFNIFQNQITTSKI